MRELELDIIEFVHQLNLLKTGSLSVAQRAILKTTYGLALESQEPEIYCRATGRETYVPQEQSELTAIAGRQSGKTSHIGALIGLYEAFRDHGLPPGERACVLVIAPVVQQATIAFKFLKKFIEASPILEQKVLKIRKDEIELRNGVSIVCRPCSYITIRGVPVICAICDEMAFWRHEETAANPEQEVIDAIRPAMATVHNTKLVKISTPYRKEGILWREFQQRGELDYPVWQLSTEEMNPAVSKMFLAKARRSNEETFRREHLGEFTDSVLGWITPEILELCIMRGQREMPRVFDATYVAAIDPAFRSSDFGFAVSHRSRDGSITIDHVARWTGTKNAPLSYELVCECIAETLRRYGINSVVGDQFCFPMLRQHFDTLGISYCEFMFGAHTRASLFGNLRQLIGQRKIAIVDEPELLRQLRSLEEMRTPSGQVDIRAPRGKDDLAVVIALAAFELSRAEEPLPPISLGLVERVVSWNSCIEDCGVARVCEKFPRCWDTGTCVCPPFADR